MSKHGPCCVKVLTLAAVVACSIIVASIPFAYAGKSTAPRPPHRQPHTQTQDVPKSGSAPDATDPLTRLNRELDKALDICRGC